MLIRFPKDDKRFSWTMHIKNKMLFYGLSEQRLRRVFKSPDRVEEGIAENTAAAVQKSRTKKNPEEIWIMYADMKKLKPSQGLNASSKSGKYLMISAWRYPGVSKPGQMIPLPDDIAQELARLSDVL